jgi:hypothetical protein
MYQAGIYNCSKNSKDKLSYPDEDARLLKEKFKEFSESIFNNLDLIFHLKSLGINEDSIQDSIYTDDLTAEQISKTI